MVIVFPQRTVYTHRSVSPQVRELYAHVVRFVADSIFCVGWALIRIYEPVGYGKDFETVTADFSSKEGVQSSASYSRILFCPAFCRQLWYLSGKVSALE